MSVIKANLANCCGVDLKFELTVQTCIDDCEHFSYTTYGILITEYYGSVVFEQPDISTDKCFVEDFITLCETKLVSLIHISDILEDYMF